MDDLISHLRSLNIEIGNAEKAHNEEFLKSVLSDQLEFHRADGTIVRKDEYFEQLAKRRYDEMNTEIDQIIVNEAQTEANVVAIVVTKGISDNNAFEGVFRNKRVWKKETDENWRLINWQNEKILFYYKQLSEKSDYSAPDGSEIRLLPEFINGGLSHCLLKVGMISKAVKHKTVREIWYIIEGNGELWQSRDGKEETLILKPGVSFTIPVGNSFQFRNTGQTDLSILISTMPKWPGKEEADDNVEGKW